MDDKIFSVDKIKKALKIQYPHGHPKFMDVMLDKMQLHSDKNFDYTGGDSNDPIGNFRRGAKIMQLWPKMNWATEEGYLLVQMLKQLDAMMTILSSGIDAKVEGVVVRAGDILVFMGILVCIFMDRQEQLDGTKN